MKAILIDDEAKGRSALKNLLTLLDDSVQVTAEASSVAEGVALIDDSEPELVFLDIQMDDGTGFDVLEQIRFKDFQLIFVTAHDEYALRAFRYSAIDYLTKCGVGICGACAAPDGQRICVDGPFLNASAL